MKRFKNESKAKKSTNLCAEIFTLLLILNQVPAPAVQECIGINFFDPAHSNLQTFTCWDAVGKSYVYKGGAATFVTCGDSSVPVDMSIGSGCLVLQTTLPNGWWNVQFKLDWGHSVNVLRTGDDPLFHLRLKWGQIASGANMYITLLDDQQIWNKYRAYAGLSNIYTSQSASVLLSNYVSPSTSEWQDVYIPMSHFLAANPNLDLTRLSILTLGGSGTYSQTNTLYIEKMRILPGIDCHYSDMIKINRLGYLPDRRKLALVSYETGTVPSAPTYFQVKDAARGTVAYEGSLTLDTPSGSSWDYSGDRVYHADFSSVTVPGRYFIACPQLGQTSPVFDIHSRAMNRAFRDALRFFYYARSGSPIVEPWAEGRPRPTLYANNTACPYDYDDNNPAKMYDYDPLNQGITSRDVQGGWFDAGDLHLDIHNNVATLWFLLKTFERFQDQLGPGVLNLPESDGQTNDLILLIQYQLEWFKKMQNPDGSVHFIVYNHSSQQQQTVSDVSTGAACVLAGIFAKACTVFSEVPGMESYTADLLSRAQLAWTWLMAHPANYNPTSASGSVWSYGIRNDASFRAFAAIELYIATGNTDYHTYFQTAFNSTGDARTAFPGDFGGTGASGSSGHYQSLALITGINGITAGYIDYVDTTRPVNTTIRNNIQGHFLTDAANALTNRNRTTYNLPLLYYNDLSWGSSGMLCGNAYILLRAYEWTGNANYRNAALDVLDWIGGRNPVSRVFLTGYGDYLHGTDHYSFYMFDHLNPVPGYLCGNINAFGGDWGQHPLPHYIQYKYKYYLNIQSAAILEPCLPWQAALCYLLGNFASDLNTPADIHSDGLIDQADLAALSGAWLTGPADDRWNPFCDLAVPYDDRVDISDLAVLVDQWIKP